MRQFRSPSRITSVWRSFRTRSESMRLRVALRCSDSVWWAARWQLINWNVCPRKDISRLMAPLFPIRLQRPAFSDPRSYNYALSFEMLLTRIAECSPRMVIVGRREYPLNTSVSISSHSFLDSQQKDRQRLRSHSCVPKKIRSGGGERVEERESSTSELRGGKEPKRFQVMATTWIFSWPDWRGCLEVCSNSQEIIKFIIKGYILRLFPFVVLGCLFIGGGYL